MLREKWGTEVQREDAGASILPGPHSRPSRGWAGPSKKSETNAQLGEEETLRGRKQNGENVRKTRTVE